MAQPQARDGAQRFFRTRFRIAVRVLWCDRRALTQRRIGLVTVNLHAAQENHVLAGGRGRSPDLLCEDHVHAPQLIAAFRAVGDRGEMHHRLGPARAARAACAQVGGYRLVTRGLQDRAERPADESRNAGDGHLHRSRTFL
jgi:hypothetical protein